MNALRVCIWVHNVICVWGFWLQSGICDLATNEKQFKAVQPMQYSWQSTTVENVKDLFSAMRTDVGPTIKPDGSYS